MISLAGSGSLYLRLSPKNKHKSPMPPSTSSNDVSVDSVKKMLEQAFFEKSRVSIIINVSYGIFLVVTYLLFMAIL